MNSFGSRLKVARLSKSLSLRDLESKSSIHYSTISQYENSVVFPQVGNLIRLSNTLKVSLHWLITGKGPRELPYIESNVDIKGTKIQLAACQKELQELRDQHNEDIHYINQLQKELLELKK